MKVYKVLNKFGDWCAFKKKEDAEYQCSLYTEYEEDVGGDDKFRVEEDEMTEDEYDELEEFEGF